MGEKARCLRRHTDRATAGTDSALGILIGIAILIILVLILVILKLLKDIIIR